MHSAGLNPIIIHALFLNLIAVCYRFFPVLVSPSHRRRPHPPEPHSVSQSHSRQLQPLLPVPVPRLLLYSMHQLQAFNAVSTAIIDTMEILLASAQKFIIRIVSRVVCYAQVLERRMETNVIITHGYIA